MMFFDLYYIDMKYVRELRKVHEHIYSVSPQSGKQNRPFLGVITLVNGKEYCVPLTSPKSKHLGKVGSDRIKVVDIHQKDSNGAFKVIGVLDFGGMIPVTGKVISKIDLKIYPSDTRENANYKHIMHKQIGWCRDNSELISRRANKIYDLVTKTPEKNKNLTNRCPDFKKLEQVLEKYLGKKRIEDGYLIEIKSPDQLAALQASGIPFQKAETSDGTIIVKVKPEHKEAAQNAIRNAQNGQKR